MNPLESSLTIMCIIFFIGVLILAYKLYYKKSKRDGKDMLLIFEGTDKSPRNILPQNTHIIALPSKQKYEACIYPNDQILIRKDEVAIFNRTKSRLVRYKQGNDVILTIRQGTQAPLTSV
jgi:hypothetical protein